jgi:hypothetical protein
MKKEEALEKQIQEHERDIAELHRKLYVIPEDLPQSYLEGLSTIRPPTTYKPTTYKPHNRLKNTRHAYLREKLKKFKQIFEEIKREEDKYSELKTGNYQTTTFKQDTKASSNCFHLPMT